MKIIAADECARIVIGFVRQIMGSDTVTKYVGSILFNVYDEITGLVMNRL